MNQNKGRNKYIIMPDSFKGTMSAEKVCRIMEEAVRQYDENAEAVSIPLADGGEGTADCLINIMGGKKIFCDVRGPYGKTIEGFYGKLPGNTAVIEMAAAAGFSLGRRAGVLNIKNDPSEATTYGVGELIKKAVEDGCQKIILGIGGSCTNDAGTGMAAALYTRFYDEYGNEFIPVGRTLNRIARIDTSETERFLSKIHIDVMCDVENPLYGENGAAYVFAPQKGADEYMVRMLDYNLRCFAESVKSSLGTDISFLPMMGAAGGMGAGAYIFLKAVLKRGIDVILDMIDFEHIIEDGRMIITGEGKFDAQSLGGKAVMGIAKRAVKNHIPVLVIAGRADVKDSNTKGLLSQQGIAGIYETDPGCYSSWEELVKNCETDLKNTVLKALTEIV
ncbi:MAG: glycerate kinase [Anaerovoracaceae bacterium]